MSKALAGYLIQYVKIQVDARVLLARDGSVM